MTGQAELGEIKSTTPISEDGKDYLMIPDFPRRPSRHTMVAKRKHVLLARDGERVSNDTFLNWEDTHFALAEQGFYMPTLALFMRRYVALKVAKEGEIELYDGSGNGISREESAELFDHHHANDTSYVRTWLDCKFVHKPFQGGFASLDFYTNHRVIGPDSKLEEFPGFQPMVDVITTRQGNRLQANLHPLDVCVWKPQHMFGSPLYVEPEFNSQGFPVKIRAPERIPDGFPSKDVEGTENRMVFHNPIGGHVYVFDTDSTGTAQLIYNKGQEGGYFSVFPCRDVY